MSIPSLTEKIGPVSSRKDAAVLFGISIGRIQKNVGINHTVNPQVISASRRPGRPDYPAA